MQPTPALPSLYSRFLRMHLGVAVLVVSIIAIMLSSVYYFNIRSLLITDFTHAADRAAHDFIYASTHKELPKLGVALQDSANHDGLLRLCAYDGEEKQFARWSPTGECPAMLITTGIEIDAFRVRIIRSVENDGKYLGSIYAEGEFLSLRQWLIRAALLYLGLLAATFPACLLASHLAARDVSAPLTALRQQVECLKDNEVGFCPLNVNVPTSEMVGLADSVASLRSYLAASMVSKERFTYLRDWHWQMMSELLAALRNNVKSDSPLLQDLNDYTLFMHLDRGDIQPPPRSFNMQDIVNASVKSVQSTFPASAAISTTISIQATMPKLLEGQPELMEALFRHLLLIGAKRIQQGFICMRIEAYARKALASTHHLRICFEDSGTIIQKGQLNQWLAPLHSDDSASGTTNDISWLLLARLIKRLGGTLEGRSGTDGGLILEGTIPVSTATEQTTATGNFCHLHSQPPLILAIENHDTDSAQHMLREAGCQVFTVRTHAQALALAPILPFSAIMLNATLPDADYDIALRLVHMAQDGVMPQVPLWVKTANPSYAESDSWSQQGVTELLRVPLKPESVRHLCESLKPLDNAFYHQYHAALRSEIEGVSIPKMNELLSQQIEKMLPIIKQLAKGKVPGDAIDQTHAVKSAALTLGYFRLAALMGEIEHSITSAPPMPHNWNTLGGIIRTIGFDRVMH